LHEIQVGKRSEAGRRPFAFAAERRRRLKQGHADDERRRLIIEPLAAVLDGDFVSSGRMVQTAEGRDRNFRNTHGELSSDEGRSECSAAESAMVDFRARCLIAKGEKVGVLRDSTAVVNGDDRRGLHMVSIVASIASMEGPRGDANFQPWRSYARQVPPLPRAVLFAVGDGRKTVRTIATVNCRAAMQTACMKKYSIPPDPGGKPSLVDDQAEEGPREKAGRVMTRVPFAAVFAFAGIFLGRVNGGPGSGSRRRSRMYKAASRGGIAGRRFSSRSIFDR